MKAETIIHQIDCRIATLKGANKEISIKFENTNTDEKIKLVMRQNDNLSRICELENVKKVITDIEVEENE
jgi:hypothetical protein